MNKLAAVALIVSVTACVPAPKKAYSPAEVQGLDDITEVMRVNAHTMDPLFAMEDQAQFDDATFARFTEASATIRSTGAALQKPAIAKSFPEGFVTFARTLETEAGKLGTAAEARDGAAAGAAIRGIHQTCRGCHDEMR